MDESGEELLDLLRTGVIIGFCRELLVPLEVILFLVCKWCERGAARRVESLVVAVAKRRSTARRARRMSRASTSLLDGLVLHEDILTPDEQATLLKHVDTWVASGANGSLAGKSYEAPPDEWRKTGQGRVAILFGVHVKCNKVSNANVEPLPPHRFT